MSQLMKKMYMIMQRIQKLKCKSLYLKKIQVMMIVAILLLLTGCFAKPAEDVIMLQQTEVELNMLDTSCKLVESINKVLVTDEMISDGMIYLSNNESDTVECAQLDIGRLGTQVAKFTYKGKVHRFNIDVVDTTAPVIESENDKYEVEVDNPYFDIEKLYSVTDNNSEGLFVGLNGKVEISKPGTYLVEVVAKDASGNQSSMSITVTIIAKKVPEDTGGSGGSGGNSGGGSNGGSSGGSPGGNTGPSSQPTPTPKLSGVKDVSIKVGSSTADLQYKLSGVSLNVAGNISINYSEVNLSVPGRYKVYYTTTVGVSASCWVTVYE